MMNNYRVLLTLTPIAKLFEKLISFQISNYFEEKKLFFKAQHCFCNGFLCESALHEFISDKNKSLDKMLITMIIFVDFNKAFDLLNSECLIRKLFHHVLSKNSIRNLTHKFIHAISKISKKIFKIYLNNYIYFYD